MPIYEYRCTSCGHQQEFLQKLSDAPVTTCTACGKPTFAKMLTAAGFQLKGSGWYATDFKSKGSGPAAKADAAPVGRESGGRRQGEARRRKAKARREQGRKQGREQGRRHKGSGPACGSGAS